jgi:formylglycine-generating enzyme required for sulfatase activity
MKVRVIATDKKGFPGLEFGDEVKSGTFLMGREKKNEGEGGVAKNINIPWSYWLSKRKISAEQYAEFLNMMQAEKKIEHSFERVKNGIVFGQELRVKVKENVPGTSYFANFNLVKNDNTNRSIGYENGKYIAYHIDAPALGITLPGALWFAKYYGYDLPTEAEWEKAARGPDHDGPGQHEAYPWGKSASSWQNSILEAEHGYGLIGMVGYYGAEYTRSRPLELSNYPNPENLNSSTHQQWTVDSESSFVLRGGGSQNWHHSDRNTLNYYYRNNWARTVHTFMSGNSQIEVKKTFRVIRRNLP